jgi:hypothetical protein
MKFRKKPVIIEAEQCFWNKKPYPEGVQTRYIDPMGRAHYDLDLEPESIVGVDYQLIVKTLEGDHIVSDGDWIITGVKGEKYPCKPDIFEMTYERLDSQTKQDELLEAKK